MRLVHKFQEFMGSITWNRFLSWGWYNTWYIAVSRDSWLAIFLDLISLPVSIALVINVITTPPWIQLFSLWDRDKIQKFQQWNKIHDYHYLDRVSTPPRRHYTIMIELTSLQESPSLSPYNDRARSTLIVVSMFKVNKDENSLFLACPRERRKESVKRKRSITNSLAKVAF